ncbi:NUDIX domain-containing protein [Nocardioides sp. WS12]|uniref:NUDIX hydrolase n=1 Tax=Nocardioides sp. WS12 TaxID=2486272 RepID=UPI0015F9B637|nr:NUDIX domain-containing protein [Nocardioides sp. WS12]
MSLERLAARVVVLDACDRILLFEEQDPAEPDRPTWWITPGGALENQESFAEAAARELREETGLCSDSLVGPIATNSFTMTYKGREVRQTEQFFAVRGEPAEVTFTAWTAFERAVLLGGRWFGIEELASSGLVFYPPRLPEIAAGAVRLTASI